MYDQRMYDQLSTTIANGMSRARTELENLVRIPSVSASGYDPAQVRRSATAVADVFRSSGMDAVELLELEGAPPAVFGHMPGPAGTPTVLLYAHHDVQPPGPEDEWTTTPFEPVEIDGRLFGRGTSDDKCGIAMHAAAIRAFDGEPPVGIKVFIEGEEEVGSTHVGGFLAAYGELLAADVIVIADSMNWRVGTPAITTSLRGLADCVVEVRTLENAVHSGQFGGAIPDALTSLTRVLAALHDDAGEVAVPGLVTSDADPLDLTEEELREQAGAVAGLELMGSGSLTTRLWRKPAISIVAIDAPPIAEAINQLVAVARAKVSLRVAPGDDPERAMAALRDHLQRAAPWGVEITVTEGATGEAIDLDTTGPGYTAFRDAFEIAYGKKPVEIGVGGSIPFVAAFAEASPEADILLTGVADPTSAAHGPNESLDLNDFRRGILTEAIAFELLAGNGIGTD